MQHRAKKKFGQNFLVDQNVVHRIVESINPQLNDRIIEIGPGFGALTKPLLQHVDHLDVIELDADVVPELLINCQSTGIPVVHNIDVLKFNFTEFKNNNLIENTLRVVGNLPYNISTVVLFHLLKHRHVIQDMHFMLQKEVVERIAAKPGSRDFGRLSVMIQAYFQVQPLFKVSAQCFRPVPKVESAILRLAPDDQYSSDIKNHAVFEQLVKQAFSQRRKTLKNNLKDLCTPDQIMMARIDPGQRAETLSVDNFLELSQQIF